MTARPVPNHNINPTSLSKSYGTSSEQVDKWIMTAFAHPCFSDVCLTDSLGMLMGGSPSVRVVLQLRDYRETEE